MVNVNVVDERVPAEPAPDPTFAELYPVGAFVAYNGPSDDGQRKRAVILEVDESAKSVTVLDGAERVAVTGDDVAKVIILAKSANAFAERVSVKARALGKANGWCSVAEEAVEELNNKSPDEDPRRQVVRVLATVEVPFELMTTRYTSGKPADELLELLRNNFYTYYSEFDRTYFRTQNSVSEDTRVSLRVVDEFPTTDEVS